MDMKKNVQRIATICFLSSWIVIGMAAHHPHSLKCEQEWKAALVNNSSLVKEAESDNGAGSSKEESNMLLRARAISILQ
jgi:hypothetical protein